MKPKPKPRTISTTRQQQTATGFVDQMLARTRRALNEASRPTAQQKALIAAARARKHERLAQRELRRADRLLRSAEASAPLDYPSLLKGYPEHSISRAETAHRLELALGPAAVPPELSVALTPDIRARLRGAPSQDPLATFRAPTLTPQQLATRAAQNRRLAEAGIVGGVLQPQTNARTFR